MKENYKPWLVKIEDFFDLSDERSRAEFLINFAVLAPSSHNSQPWNFSINEDYIEVSINTGRRLLESDKDDRQAFISLGCAIENILIAADYYGYDAGVVFTQYKTVKINLNHRKHKKADNHHLIFSITKRVTNRSKYKSDFVPTKLLEEIKGRVIRDMKVFVVSDLKVKNKIADAALTASIAAMEDGGFRNELSRYVQPNTTRSKLGMPCFGMGIPTIISFIAPTLIRFLNMNKLSHKSDSKLLKEHTPHLIIVATRQDVWESWIEVGRIYERIALLSTRAKVGSAMWAAPIQIGEFYKDLQEILNTDYRPQALFRLGYTDTDVPHSPRLSSKEVII